MKLPSGQEIKDTEVSEMADSLALMMISEELTFDDVVGLRGDELYELLGGDVERSPADWLAEFAFIVQALRQPVLSYRQKLEEARSRVYEEMLGHKVW